MLARFLSRFREWSAVADGSPAPTTRWDPWYAVLVCCALIAGIVIELQVGIGSPFDAPIWGLFLLGFVALIGGMWSRIGEGDTHYVDQTLLAACTAAAVYGPLPAVMLLVVVHGLSLWPQRRVMGGWHQYLLGISNLAGTGLVNGVTFALVWHAIAGFNADWALLPSLLAMMTASTLVNMLVNVAWVRIGAGQRGSLTDLANVYREDALSTAWQTLIIAMAVVSVQHQPITAIGLMAPLAIATLNERLQQKHRRSEQELRLDPLTGLFNRRHFWEQLAIHCDETVATGGDGAIVMITDIDNFKILNDTHGHVEGDRALIDTAHAMRDAVGRRGTVARYGGEEFGILLDDGDMDVACEVAESVRLAALEALSEWGTSLSIGIARIEEGEIPVDVTQRADKALYSSKHHGKNRWTIAAPAELAEVLPIDQGAAGPVPSSDARAA
jgi:diguanylate cyclase (GGDEF)-like protein